MRPKVLNPWGLVRSGHHGLNNHRQRNEEKMAKSVNKVILVGNVGRTPEVKFTPSGTPVANFSLATNERYKDKAGEWQDRTEWHNVVAWQRLAEIVGEFVGHGSKVYIEGRLQTRKYTGRDQQEKYITEIVAGDVIVLSGGRDHKGQEEKQQEKQQELPHQQPASAEITDEDIPF